LGIAVKRQHLGARLSEPQAVPTGSGSAVEHAPAARQQSGGFLEQHTLVDEGRRHATI
jgi:hypothetical protein